MSRASEQVVLGAVLSVWVPCDWLGLREEHLTPGLLRALWRHAELYHRRKHRTLLDVVSAVEGEHPGAGREHTAMVVCGLLSLPTLPPSVVLRHAEGLRAAHYRRRVQDALDVAARQLRMGAITAREAARLAAEVAP